MARTVMITGCSSGFGKASAELFAVRGWNVVATMRRPEDSAIAAPAHQLLVVGLDVTNVDSIAAAIGAAIGRFGRIDAVVNNAGVGLFSVFETTPMEVMRHVFETNVFGMINVIQAVVPHFRAQSGGTIVNVSSGSGIAPAPLMSIYSASKHAVEGLSEALYHELATQRVMVRLVEPGFVKQTSFVDTTVATSQKAPVPASYEAYVGQIMQAFTDAYPMELATEEQVAAAIYQAASETGQRLRYIAGPDTEVQAKARWTTSEDEYMALMRSMFMQKVTLSAAAGD